MVGVAVAIAGVLGATIAVIATLTGDDGSAGVAGLEPDEPLPTDERIETGTLENGLTYMVRDTQGAGQPIELRLAVDAGSVLEEDDQRGFAHFVEHMLFNGTEAYPANELDAVLEGFGSAMGPDVNAYTSYDETIYQLSVVDDDEVVAEAVDVLAQWAHAATFEPAEVEAERGVLLDEWRVRGLGLQPRVAQAFEQQLLAGSPYADRSPIGTVELIETASAEELRRFYEDWYRPDLMAVVVVGDVDTARIVDLIEDGFGGLPPAAADAPERPEVEVDFTAIPPIAVHLDPEQPSAWAEIVFPIELRPIRTVRDVIDTVTRGLVFDMLTTRLRNDAIRGDAGYLSVQTYANPLVRSFLAPGWLVDAEPTSVAESIAHVLREIDRADRFGFSEQEVERAIAAYRRTNRQYYDGRASIGNAAWADSDVSSFLTGATAISAQTDYDVTTAVLDAVDAGMLEEALDDLLDATTTISVFGPASAADELPTVAEVEALVAATEEAELEPRAEESGVDVLMDAPEPAAILSSSEIPGVDRGPGRTLLLANGVEVHLLPTDLTDDEVAFAAVSPGGFSVIPDAWVPEASMIGNLLASSGLGPFDAATLGQLLADQAVTLVPFLAETIEGFTGTAATADLETLLQLVHLEATAPRIDQQAVDTVLGQVRPVLVDLNVNPDYAVQDLYLVARFGAGSRQRTVQFAPTVEEIDGISAADAQALAEDRFGDLTDATFALVGDFDIDEAEDLVARYLGTLPDSGRSETWADVRADPPWGIVDVPARVGEPGQARAVFGFTGPIGWSQHRDLSLRVLQHVLQSRLSDRLREELGITYSPYVSYASSSMPQPETDIYIEVTADPARLDDVVDEVLEIITDLGEEGPTRAEVDTAVGVLVEDLRFFANDELAGMLVRIDGDAEEDLGELLDRSERIRRVTAGDLRSLSGNVLSPDRYILIRQLPADVDGG